MNPYHMARQYFRRLQTGMAVSALPAGIYSRLPNNPIKVVNWNPGRTRSVWKPTSVTGLIRGGARYEFREDCSMSETWQKTASGGPARTSEGVPSWAQGQVDLGRTLKNMMGEGGICLVQEFFKEDWHHTQTGFRAGLQGGCAVVGIDPLGAGIDTAGKTTCTVIGWPRCGWRRLGSRWAPRRSATGHRFGWCDVLLRRHHGTP